MPNENRQRVQEIGLFFNLSIMKKFFALFAIIFAFNANLFAPNENLALRGDAFDQMMYQDHNDWWTWDRELRENIRKYSYWTPK